MLIYSATQAYEMIAESAEEFREPFGAHLADVRVQIERNDWTGEDEGSIIDLESMIWGLNELHGRKNDMHLGSSVAERKAFAAVIACL